MDQSSLEKILFIGFNQDCGNNYFMVDCILYNANLFIPFPIQECFTCGLEDGYRIYNTEPLKETAREGKIILSKTIQFLFRTIYYDVLCNEKMMAG